MKKYTHIIWDFNGTIYNDVDASRTATNVLLKDRGLKEICSVGEMRDRFYFPVKDYYADLGFDYGTESFERIADEWSALYDEFSKKYGLNANLRPVLRKIKESGYVQVIISSCEIGLLKRKLRELEVERFFDDVNGNTEGNGYGKLTLARKWLERSGEIRALLIGDTDHDYETARALGADALLYSGGFESRERLLLNGCPVIDDFNEIFDYLKT